MEIVCVREGRVGYHVGDIVEIPDDTAGFDTNHFAVLMPSHSEDDAAKKEAELADLNAQLDAAEADNAEADNEE